MIRRPPRSTLFPLHDALPICREEDPARSSVDPDVILHHEHPAAGCLGRGRAGVRVLDREAGTGLDPDRKSTRLNSSHANISYAVFCLKKKKALKEREYLIYRT